MLDNFIYEDHLGKQFIGLDHNVYLNYNDLRDYEWNYDVINNRISRFYQSVKSRKIPLVIFCKTDAAAIAVKHRLLELTETDLHALKPGKVRIGDYYTSGYITSSVKSDYLIDKRLCKLELTLTSDNPLWYSEKTHTFSMDSRNVIDAGKGVDYPYGYSYDYTLITAGRSINCDSIGGGTYKLLIYGPAENPAVNIGANTYAVKGRVGTGEVLLIDGLTKTITLTTASGRKVNWFDHRSREFYIFEPIATGQNAVTWNGSFNFDLTIIEKRSEPKWI